MVFGILAALLRRRDDASVADDGSTVLAPVGVGTLPLVGINGFGVAVGAISLSARRE